ncbi:MAG: endolytic transglycosylase MltG, partial [Reyranellales bacterium]
MLSFFRWVLFFIALFATLMGGALFVGHTLLTAEGPLATTKHVVIARGAGPATMAKVLQEEGIISYPRLFRVALMVDPAPKPIKAGEYEVPAHTSMAALVELLQSGKVVQRRLTVPEGMTTAEIVELVRKADALSGDITLDLKEGDLLPETYFYSRDDTRDGLLSRMKEAMTKTLDEAWRKRLAGLPLANRREALILASMIEKETAIAAERAKIAAVFINRLRRKMKLESDPTTIYGLTGGKSLLG